MSRSESNNAQTLITEHLDLWSSAITARNTTGRGSNKKIELYGVKKLRELILELAVRGKLVPQDPNDEPASELLSRVEVKKLQLVKRGIIKKQKNLTELGIYADLPYDLPVGWIWCRLGVVGYTQTGGTPKKADSHYYGNDCPFIKPGDILDGEITSYDSDGLSSEGALALGRLAPAGSVLMVCIGSIGKCALVDRQVSFNQQINSITPYLEIGPYLRRYLQSESFQSEAWSGSSSTTLAILNKGKWEQIPVAIPPEQEQHRIVAKVDELMALCDQLENQTEQSLDAHATLADTLLDALTQAQSHTELMGNWARLEQNWDILFPSTIAGLRAIDKLKQTILQLAVMGKLVPQDPTDEPASELLKRIFAEKEQLVKDKKIKKQKPLPPITDEEKPFELPEGWEWCRFGMLGYDLGGGTPTKSNGDYWNGTIPWVSPKDMKVDKIISAQDSITELAIEDSTVKLIPVGSLLMVVRGMILAHSFPVAITEVPVVINQDMKALVFSELDKDFMLLMVKGIKNELVSLVERSSHGTCKLVSNTLWLQFVAIPPKDEQKRIVAKVEELTSVCDQLKELVENSVQTRNHLTDALVRQVLN
ncbi:restriction endonuclease subunit S [Gilvimarinus sp. SDUM040013]|uniref:Restriction endonuclease subunit S n=1 Tax=Gilvimarinus gilvus TaxID=3058038 RepID=A0ABU4RUW4_9GAMM|nr:restriction endonuclease subunit S [Gilvimarinus sp. SDUM040013]MDO3387958.1 restriction endonuclease subunit S [Gilvimarinus sp. SDUM040013]MDX6848671.1 restriction endonuclease subunit S [Gilvimarinus sp. SDUM040013]